MQFPRFVFISPLMKVLLLCVIISCCGLSISAEKQQSGSPKNSNGDDKITVEVGLEGVIEVQTTLENGKPVSSPGNDKTISSQSDSVCGSLDMDHLECDIETLQISAEHLELVKRTYNSEIVQSADTAELASKSGVQITPHFVYRYYASSAFSETFHGTPVDEAIRSTVQWRADFGITDIDTAPLRKMIENGLAYVDDTLDKNNKAIIYIRTQDMSSALNDLYIPMIMYTIEKAQKMTVAQGNGEFVCMIDLDGLTWSKTPPVSVLKFLMGLLKMHYPYRLGTIYILNPGTAFTMIWRLCKPFIPQRALSKTFVITKSEAKALLEEKLGLENVEQTFGGERLNKGAVHDVDAYIAR